MENITFDDFAKLDIRIGRIISCEKVENADKLLRLEVDFGDPSTGHSTLMDEPLGSDSKSSGLGRRQIVSGIAQWYTPEGLIGKLCPFVVNLEPRTFRGVESQGMLVATGTEEGAVLLHPDKEVPEGAIIL